MESTVFSAFISRPLVRRRFPTLTLELIAIAGLRHGFHRFVFENRTRVIALGLPWFINIPAEESN